MIESRYKIEYVIPDSTEKKSSKLRFFAYLLLIPIVLSVVGSITYNFSLNELTTDTVGLFQKIKVEVLNLDSDPENLNSQNNLAVSKETTQLISVPFTVESNPTKNNTDLPEDVVLDLEDKVEGLLIKNKKHIEASEKQLATNALLTKNIKDLSEQLATEKSKNEFLNEQVSKQEEDKLSLTELLNKTLEKPKAEENKVVSTSNYVDGNKILTNVDDTKTVIGNERSVNLSVNVNLEKEAAQKVPQKISQETGDETVSKNIDDTASETNETNETISTAKTSEVDAIIAAMKGIQTTPKNNTENLNSKLDKSSKELIDNKNKETGIQNTKSIEGVSQVNN